MKTQSALGISPSAEREEGSAPSTVSPFKKGGQKLLVFLTVPQALSIISAIRFCRADCFLS